MTWYAKAQCFLPAIMHGDFQRFQKNVNIESGLLTYRITIESCQMI